MMLLHGEESVTFVKPLVPETKYLVSKKNVDIQDKGSGALLMTEYSIAEADTGDVASVVRAGIFIRGMGGFGYKGTIKSVYPATPSRQPDLVQEEPTLSN
jgi:hypothetical protein